jgi:hypothetical protein
MRIVHAIILALLAFGIIPEFIRIPSPRWVTEYGSHPSSWTNGVKYDLERFQNDLICAIADPVFEIWQLVVAFAVYTIVARRRDNSRSHGETLCRKCGYILRGLTAPRCPECGGHI